jgi:hypothetical protein
MSRKLYFIPHYVDTDKFNPTSTRAANQSSDVAGLAGAWVTMVGLSCGLPETRCAIEDSCRPAWHNAAACPESRHVDDGSPEQTLDSRPKRIVLTCRI